MSGHTGKARSGARLRRLREEQQISQAALARRLDLSTSYVNQLENDHRPLTVPVLMALRREHPVFRRRKWFQGRPIMGDRNAEGRGETLVSSSMANRSEPVEAVQAPAAASAVGWAYCATTPTASVTVAVPRSAPSTNSR